MESEIKKIIQSTAESLHRPDLFRKPLVSFSSASDPRYPSLKEKIGPWHMTPEELLPGAVSVISYFVPFTKSAALHPNDSDEGSPIWAEAYQEFNKHFININDAVISLLKQNGYDAVAIPPTHTYSPTDLKCLWSHRSAAVISGLGSFGANGLVITEKGSGGRFCSVITSAKLTPNTEAAEQRCLYLKSGTCGLCFNICPVNALNPDRFEKFVCQDRLNHNEKEITSKTGLQSADICGKCISICPFAYIK